MNDQAVTPRLNMALGDLASQDIAVGRWLMQSSVSGRFTGFSAQFTHADALGGELTSDYGNHRAFFIKGCHS